MKKLFLIFALSISFLSNAKETDSTKVDNFQKTDEVLSKVVEKALNVAEKTGDFVIEQAPLLLQEFYNWHILKHSFSVLIGIIILLTGYNLRKLWGKKVDKDYEADWNEVVINGYASEEVSTFMTMGVGFIFGAAILAVGLYKLCFILVAPKLYLIEYFIK